MLDGDGDNDDDDLRPQDASASSSSRTRHNTRAISPSTVNEDGSDFVYPDDWDEGMRWAFEECGRYRDEEEPDPPRFFSAEGAAGSDHQVTEDEVLRTGVRELLRRCERNEKRLRTTADQ